MINRRNLFIIRSFNRIMSGPRSNLAIRYSSAHVRHDLKVTGDPNPSETYLKAFLPMYWKWVDEQKP